MNISLALLLLSICYILVTVVGITHTVILWKVFKVGDSNSNIKATQVPAYKATEKYHPLYNILLFPIFAYLYFMYTPYTDIHLTALYLGLFWTAITVVVDLIGWVIIKHPWSMTVKEMYIDYQPWITLIYIAILASPFLAAIVIQL